MLKSFIVMYFFAVILYLLFSLYYRKTPDSFRNNQGVNHVQDDEGLPVNRTRSSSLSAPSKQPATTRKRTSSGVCQVEEAEPPPKRPELTKTVTENTKPREIQTSGRRKDSESEKDKRKEKHVDITKRKDLANLAKEKRKETEIVIEKFDSKSMTQCVTAFKESDSWD